MVELLQYVHNVAMFNELVQRVQRLPDSDPQLAFRSTTPGILQDIVRQDGPWRGFEQRVWEMAFGAEDALAVAPDERARQGKRDAARIVANPGLILAGRTMRVAPDMFRYGGMTEQVANELAARPQLDFNQKVAKTLADVVTMGDYSGSPTDNYVWAATTQDGQSVNGTTLATQGATQVGNVFANGSQTFTAWPLRNGTQAAAGHDHYTDTAAWTEALAATARDNILEHPGMGRVTAYVGSTTAGLVRAALKTEYGAISERVPLVREGLSREGGFFSGQAFGTIGSVDYVHVPDLPVEGALYVAQGHKPFHSNIGMLAANGGREIETGGWSEPGDAERRGMFFGFREYGNFGVSEPLATSYVTHTV